MGELCRIVWRLESGIERAGSFAVWQIKTILAGSGACERGIRSSIHSRARERGVDGGFTVTGRESATPPRWERREVVHDLAQRTAT